MTDLRGLSEPRLQRIVESGGYDASPFEVLQMVRQIQALTLEIRAMRECPMILCPFEAENAKLRADLATAQQENEKLRKELGRG